MADRLYIEVKNKTRQQDFRWKFCKWRREKGSELSRIHGKECKGRDESLKEAGLFVTKTDKNENSQI